MPNLRVDDPWIVMLGSDHGVYDAPADSSQLRSALLTLISSIIQLVCLTWYLVSYFPMGSTGLRFAARFGGNRIAAWVNE